MSEHTELRIKQCSIPQQCIVVDVLTDGKRFSMQMPVVYAEFIVRACNRDDAFEDLLAACKEWMKVESESKTSNPCPDYALRGIYRVKAVKLSKAAIEKAEPK